MSSSTLDAANAAVLVRTFGSFPLIYNGSLWDFRRSANVFADQSAVVIGTIATVWTPTAGKKFRFLGGVFSVSAAVSILFEDNAAGAYVWRTPKLPVDTPFALTLPGNGYLSLAANNLLKATGSAAANLTGVLFGTCE